MLAHAQPQYSKTVLPVHLHAHAQLHELFTKEDVICFVKTWAAWYNTRLLIELTRRQSLFFLYGLWGGPSRVQCMLHQVVRNMLHVAQPTSPLMKITVFKQDRSNQQTNAFKP